MNKMQPPFVCICVPTYNAASTIKETLQSILMQDFDNLVVKVVDNASLDDTVNVVQSLKDPRLQLHAHDNNIGAEGNFNRCIALAEGDYTAIFHADDIYERQMVSKQVAFLECHASVGGVFTEASIINEDGRVTGGLRAHPQHRDDAFTIYTFPQLFRKVLRYSNFLICPSALLRTDIYKLHIKNWNGGAFKSSADLDVWLRAAQIGKIAILHEKLMRYRISSMQFSSALRARVNRSDFLLVIDHYLSLDWVQASLDKQDRRYARALERTDCTVRALNLYLADRVSEANHLSALALDGEAFLLAIKGRRGLLTLLVALTLQMLIRLRLKKIARPLLAWIKRRMRK